jgi:hypothetical protein
LTIGKITASNQSNHGYGWNHGHKGSYTTTIAIDLSLIPEEAWDGNQLINEATATGCYEKNHMGS